ncbi:unnamed protein product [Heterobilharzia americana]|nr:unnamed protein product [Heterobilharzia americana]
MLNSKFPSDILNRNGFDKQYEEYQHGIQLTQCVANILREKCELQSDYSRGLSKLSDRLRDALAGTTDGTVHTAWLRIATTVEMESKLNEKFAENLLNNLIQPLNDLIVTFKQNQKPLKKLVDKETENLLSFSEMESRARHKLFSCFHYYERVYNNYFTSNSLLEHYSPLRRNSFESHILGSVFTKDSSRLPSCININSSTTHPSLSSLSHVKSSSFSSADLKSNPIQRHNSLSSTDTNVKKLMTLDKLRHSYYTTLTDYYRVCITAEEARIDWHTRMLKCFNDQRTLESQRLNSLAKGLTVYRNSLADTIPTWKAAINELANAITLADPSLDMQNFRRRSHQDTFSKYQKT